MGAVVSLCAASGGPHDKQHNIYRKRVEANRRGAAGPDPRKGCWVLAWLVGTPVCIPDIGTPFWGGGAFGKVSPCAGKGSKDKVRGTRIYG